MIAHNEIPEAVTNRARVQITFGHALWAVGVLKGHHPGSDTVRVDITEGKYAGESTLTARTSVTLI